MENVDMQAIKDNLELKQDFELLEILVKNNEDEWQDGVFNIIEEILLSRGIKPPKRDKAKTEDIMSTDTVTVDRTHKYYGVKGWLFFFCTLQIFFKPALFILLWITNSNTLERAFKSYPALKTISIIEILIGSFILIYGFDIGISIIKKMKDAVKAAKTFLIVSLITTIFLGFIPFLADLPEHIKKAFGAQFIKNNIGVVIFVSIWLAYFNKSKRVKATFPLNRVSTKKGTHAIHL